MRIYFYPECNFNINKASVYDCGSLAEWFDSQHKNPDDYEIVGRDGEYHDCDYDGEVCAVYPKIMGGKKKGKNILTAVLGLALILTGGGALAHALHITGTMAKSLGAGLLLSGGGALLMGKMKMPAMDIDSESATKQSYQWNVGNLSTSRGVKGVTFGTNVIPEGELLAYQTYGTNEFKKITDKEAGWYINGNYEGFYSKTKPTKKKNAWGTYKKLSAIEHRETIDESSWLEMLIGAGEGELDSIADIKINDIPVADLGMVLDEDYAIRLGSNTQTALKQTKLDSQVGYSSIGQTVPVKLNGSVTPLLITTPSVCDSCCIAFQTPSWYLYDTSSGAKNKAYVKLKIGYRASGSSGAYTYVKTKVDEIDNERPFKAESAFYFQITIKFPSNGTYQICIENDSAELNRTKGLLTASEYSGSALPDRASINISCDNIACYNNKEQTYPNTALIWLRIPASQTLNGSMPKVTWKQTRANIYAYNGSSYVTKPADNLAWAIYDIIAQVRKDGNTYHNEGEDVANIDFDKFVAFASFCDSIGAKGNWFLNKLDTSWSNAMSVATSCRAFIGLRSGKVCPYWDAPTEMTQIFTVGNYEDMSGVITAKKDRAKAIEATFNNEEEKFASRTVRVEIDNDHSAEAVSMTFVGLSNPVNVSKQAHYILRRNKYLVQSVKFTADIDSIVCELNDVIGIQCDLTEYGVGGRIFKVENNVISLDAPVTLESGKTYALLVRHTDGTLERNTPVETNGTFTQLTFNSAWSKPVLKGDVYSFGIANSEVRKYRVTGITRTNDLKAQIEAIEYNENVYDELAVAPYTYTNPNAGINNVTATYTPEAVELAWDANNNTSYVNVYVDGVFYGRYQNGAQIPNINSQQLVEMFPVNEYGEEDTPVVRTISNNLPTPSTPPVPVVQSTTTGCVAEFSGIPKDENIVWLIIKEGENELGRATILGEYMSVSIQLRSGTHTLSAYFVNQFSKSSQARTFTATPLGDITANNISATALAMPTGSILRLSAKNCTTASIIAENGVKDVSGYGNHGEGHQNVTVLDGGNGFSFDGSSAWITFDKSALISRINGCKELTIIIKSKLSNTANPRVGGLVRSGAVMGFFNYVDNSHIAFWDRLQSSDTIKGLESEFSNAYTDVHEFAATVNYQTGLAVLFIDGEEKARNTGWFTGTKADVNTVLLGRSQSSATFAGEVYDFRIYPRALSASEIKAIFMFPDDVTFGQLTTDMFGANIIHANYILNDGALASLAVQAVNADIQNLNVSGTASFIGLSNKVTAKYGTCSTGASTAAKVVDLDNFVLFTGAQISVKFTNTNSVANPTLNVEGTGAKTIRAKDANLTASSLYNWVANDVVDFVYDGTYWVISDISAKDYSNTELAKKMSIASYCAANDTTKIDGANIYAGSVTTEQVAANAITAEKLSVISMSPSPTVHLSAKNSSITDGNLVADLSGNNKTFKIATNWTRAETAFWHWRSSSANAKRIINNTDVTISIPASFSIALFCRTTTNGCANSPVVFDAYVAASGNNNRVTIYFDTSRKVKVDVYNASGTKTTLTLGTMGNGADNLLVVSCNAGTWSSFIGSFFSSTKVTKTTSSTTATHTAITADCVAWGNLYSGSSSRGSSELRIGEMEIFGSALTEEQANVILVQGFAIQNEAGAITSERLSTNAIKSRNYAYSSGLYSTAGTFLDLANGQIISKNFSIDSSGNATFKGALSGATGSFTGAVTATSGSFNGKLSCGDLTFYPLQSQITLAPSTRGKYLNIRVLPRSTVADNRKIISVCVGNSIGEEIEISAMCETLSNETKFNWVGSMYIAKRKGYFAAQFNYNSFQSAYLRYDTNYLYISIYISPTPDTVTGYGNITYSIVQVNGAVDLSILSFASATSATGTNSKSISLTSSASRFGTNNLFIDQGDITLSSGTGYASGGWTTSCDESIKKDIKDVSTLNKLKSIRVKKFKYSQKALLEKEWRYEQALKIEENLKKGIKTEEEPMPEFKDDENAPDYIMAMAGEFNKAFGVDNGNEESINYTNAIGVALRAIQELAAEVDELKAKLKIQQDEKSDTEQK